MARVNGAYMGKRMGDDRKLHHLFQTGEFGELWFETSSKNIKAMHLVIGRAYPMDNADGIGKSWKFPERLPISVGWDEDYAIQWDLESRAAEAEFAARKDVATPLQQALEPVRVAYQRLPYPARQQMLVQIVQFLNRKA